MEGCKVESLDTEGPPAKMRRGEGPKVELRFLISFKTAGVIIGKGGENINKIREEYAVKISISDSCGPERVLTLDGDMGSVMEILTSVLNRQVSNNREDGIDLRLLVHQSQAGCVIGRCGYKIKELREQSNLRTLKVYQMLCPSSTDRVIQLVGEVDKVLDCLQNIAELLEGAPPKGSRKNYDPLDADESVAAEYGGWGSPGQGLSLNMVGRRNIGGAYGQNNLLSSGLFGGRNGVNGNGTSGHQAGAAGNGLTSHQLTSGAGGGATGAGNGGQNNAAAVVAAAAVNQALAGTTGAYHPHHAAAAAAAAVGAGGAGEAGGPATGGLPHASAAAMLAATGGQTAGGPTAGPAGDAAAAHQAAAAAIVAAGMMRGNVNARLSILGPQTKAKVSVQNKMIGAIMGRGGCRINQVRQESGADIKIDKQEPGVENRIITITGTPEQIHNAQFLMQVCVKRYGDQSGV